jgi:chromosomal replication initiation ATPase DnaA
MNNQLISPYIYPILTNKHKTAFVVQLILSKFGYDKDSIRSTSSKKEIVLAKKVLAYYLYKECKLTLVDIAGRISLDHSSVSHHLKDIKEKIEIQDKKILPIINELNTLLDV